jgi:hypothetical protein
MTKTAILYKNCLQLLGRSHDTTTDSQNSHSSTTVPYALPNFIALRKTTQENHMKIRIPYTLLREKEYSSSSQKRLR